MTDLPDRPIQRLRKPSWRDSRLVAGVLLVLAATALGSYVVARADDRVGVYVAADTLLPGERLTSDRLERREVQLDDSMPSYLSAERALPPAGFLVREVRKGELVPASAIATQSEIGVQSVTVLVEATSARPLVRGSVIDVYANARKPGGAVDEFLGPELLLEDVVVAAPADEDGGFGARSDALPVRLLIPAAKVAAVIEHLDAGSRLTVVPVAGSQVRGAS